MGATPTTGNLIVAVLLYIDGSTANAHATFADGLSNAFAVTPNSPSNARPTTAGLVYIAYLQAPASPNAAITATFDAIVSGGVATLWVAEYAPTSGTNGGLDSDIAGTGTTGTTINTPTLTVNQANDLCIVAALADHVVSTVDTPWTQRVAGVANQFSEGIGDILARSTNVTAAMTENVSSGWDSLAASFKFTPPASGPVGHEFTYLQAVKQAANW